MGYNTHFERAKKKHWYEQPEGKSLTIPNEAFSMAEILEKFTTGITPAVYKEGVYHEGDFDSADWEEISRMDLSEQQEVIQQIEQDIEFHKNELKKQDDDRKKLEKQLSEFKKNQGGTNPTEPLETDE